MKESRLRISVNANVSKEIVLQVLDCLKMKEQEQNNPDFIYHLVLESEFLNQTRDNMYTPLFFCKRDLFTAPMGKI